MYRDRAGLVATDGVDADEALVLTALAAGKPFAEAGRLLGITILDHVVFTRESGFHSLREHAPSDLGS